MYQPPSENNYSQPPVYPPQRPPTKDKSIPWAIFLGSLALLLIFVIAYSWRLHEATSTEPQFNAIVATPPPITRIVSPTGTVQPEEWTTIETFHGASDQITDSFSVTGPWRLQWTCYPPRQYGYTSTYNLFIRANETLIVNTICSGSNLTGQTIQYSSGMVYLDISSIGQWAINVQLLE